MLLLWLLLWLLMLMLLVAVVDVVVRVRVLPLLMLIAAFMPVRQCLQPSNIAIKLAKASI